MKIIIWTLFIVLSIYSILDYYLSTSLFKLGFDELNPIMLWIIGAENKFINILYFKILTLSIVGFLLIFYTIKKS